MKTLKSRCVVKGNRQGRHQPQSISFTKQLSETFFDLPFKKLLLVLIGWKAFAGTTSAQQVYVMEFNQGNNLFGVFDIVTGVFTQRGNEGATLFNDIAVGANGTLYGIVNSTSLVTLNEANGAIESRVNFNVSGIESMAIAPDGTMYGATQSALYTIDPSDGDATFVGNFNNNLLNNVGQNIRFAANGNLYDTDGGGNPLNTDLFQINLKTGKATTVGVIESFPGLCLGNAGDVMYGVGIQLNSASTVTQGLVAIDLSSIKPGGTNANGTLADINFSIVNTGFPNNYNFSGPRAVPPSNVPEPSAAILSMGACLSLRAMRYRRR